jgi:AbiV family abortive infection protein
LLLTQCVQPRSLHRIVNVPLADRNAIIAEGIGHLVEHVGQLRKGTELLNGASQHRSAAILDMVASEEAAKVMILLDLVRLGWDDPETVKRQVSYFSSHLARGIYSRLIEWDLGHYGEARQQVERLREDRFLDGPNDVDWIFRNEIETEREELLYVDYVAYETEGVRWVSPATHEEFRGGRMDKGVLLVQAMDRLNMLSLPVLDLLASYDWPAISDDAYMYASQRQETWSFIETLDKAALLPPESARADLSLVLERWQFPLHGLDLRRRRVSDDELRNQRQRALDQLNRDYMD